MSLQRFFKGKGKAEADRSSLGNDSTPTYTSNDTAAPTYNLPGRDSDETKSSTYPSTGNKTTHNLPGRDSETPFEYSLTDTPGVVNYSKHPFDKFKLSLLPICVNFVSIL